MAQYIWRLENYYYLCIIQVVYNIKNTIDNG